ncbi:MAG: DUF4389 domain-containing protein [Actinobacteria bacterium]|uniref:Unannotated protein n=1 Tax=freshwater metagenome TaxID=449393 RepID=A0A6J6BII0_9ZZZZ|nr:DUF4389 domain-containing protein [Actinomycetota bacterium]
MSSSSVSYEGASNQVETSIEIQLTNRDRKTVFFRGILVFPAVVFIASFTQSMDAGASFGGLLFLPALLALLVRGVYPSYVLSFNKSMLELNARIAAFALLLTDEYPSIEANPNIKVELPEIEGGAKLSRVLPLVKWIFAIPLFIVGIVYALIALVLTFAAWIITSATGNYPESIANFVLGTIEFWNRVYGYAAILVTDDYPPFTL